MADFIVVSNGNAPSIHAASHRHGGSDETGQAVAAPNALVKARSDGTIDPNYVPGSVTATANGLVKADASGKIDTNYVPGVVTATANALPRLDANGYLPVVQAPKEPISKATISDGVTRTLALNAHTILNFNTITEDASSFITPGATWKFQPTIPGMYLISATSLLSGSAVAAGEVWVFNFVMNGVTGSAPSQVINYIQYPTAVTSYTSGSGSALIRFNGTTDYLYVTWQQATGTATRVVYNPGADGARHNVFSAVRVGP